MTAEGDECTTCHKGTMVRKDTWIRGKRGPDVLVCSSCKRRMIMLQETKLQDVPEGQRRLM